MDIALTSTLTSNPGDPKTYAEACKCSDFEEWKEAMIEELNNIKEKKVWKKIKAKQMLPGKTKLGTKWVFKTKNNGRKRARLVVQGYSQIPGVNFTELHSPVANDVTIRVLVTLALIFKWDIQ